MSSTFNEEVKEADVEEDNNMDEHNNGKGKEVGLEGWEEPKWRRTKSFRIIYAVNDTDDVSDEDDAGDLDEKVTAVLTI